MQRAWNACHIEGAVHLLQKIRLGAFGAAASVV
jgi:hypothetical protein